MKKNLVVLFFLASTLLLKAAGYKTGDNAMDFSLKNIDGKMVSLKDYSTAKGFIIVFTCNHCPFAKAYESRIIDLDKKYASKGFPVIAINPNDPVKEPADSYQNMVALAKEKQYPFPYLFDESQQIATAYGAARTPHVYIVQKEQGKLVVKYIGAIDNNSDEPEMATEKYAENALDALIQGKNVAVKETKAIGCTIKWKNPQ